MKYTQERNASAEIARIALQKLAPHQLSLNPMNFAVWYEYVSGINQALNSEMDQLLRDHPKLSEEQVEQLYADHVSECGSKLQVTLREDLKQLLGTLNQLTRDADRQTTDYGSTLQEFSERLKKDLTVSELDALVQTLSSDTVKMQASMHQMHADLIATHQEVERLNQEMEILKGAAMTDPLTGVLNRRGFESSVEAIFDDPEKSGQKGHCLLMLDVDHFKHINDTYGHLLGDKVLATIANTLRIKVQGQDIVGRLGGEEFAILLPNTNLDGAFAVAEHIRQAIERGKIRRLDSNENIEGITISIGVSARQKDEKLLDLIARADKALYRSKKEGRNRITIIE